jgi:N utilization substance protein B
MNRHLSRTLAMQILYEWDFRGRKAFDKILGRSIGIFRKDLDLRYLRKVVRGVKDNLDKLDRQILEVAPEFPIEQIANIDKAILRVAIYELENCDDIPPKVIINEAVEIAKAFGGDNSYKFVNGVLGTIYRKSDHYQPEDDTDKIKEIKEIKEVKDEKE